jgi:hypothetical protein
VGSTSLAPLPTASSAPAKVPGGPSPGGPAPAEKGKDKVPVPEHHHKDNAEESKSRRLQRGDSSFIGERAPKR